MFVSFTDWEFDGNIDNAVEGIKGFWPEMQKYGAVNTRCTITGDNILRTITLWSSKVLLEENIYKGRAIAGSGASI